MAMDDRSVYRSIGREEEINEAFDRIEEWWGGTEKEK
jgi:hypothetical protein